jgi:Zn-dependent peptidase ImmA (M78 family)/DNA-binding XRE family transcriptional regulator
MSIDLVVLGKRLRQARENCNITQQQAADAIGVPRTGIVHIEAGSRVPSTLELSDLAQLYKRSITDFLAPAVEEEQALTFHLRVQDILRDHPTVTCQVERWVEVCKEGAELQAILGGKRTEALPLYALPEPENINEAIEQGESVAEQERKRLGLGDAPVHRLEDLLSSEGIWAASVNFPDEICGLFLSDASMGMVILVNNRHWRPRKRFSFAHEYAHALMDRERRTLVTTKKNSTERIERRANAFAGAFLLPASGVRAFLDSVDKGSGSRQTHAVYGINGSEESEGRSQPGAQKIVYQDVALLARYYGVSYQAAVYRLRDIGAINLAMKEQLIQQEGRANQYLKMLDFGKAIDGEGLEPNTKEETSELVSQVVYRAIEAYRREEITKGRLLELSKKLNVPGKELVQLAEAAL